MNGQVKIEFISKGFKEILNSNGTKSIVESAAKSIQRKANGNLTKKSEGYSINTWHGNYGGGRYIASVSTTDHNSMVEESENKALSKAVSN